MPQYGNFYWIRFVMIAFSGFNDDIIGIKKNLHINFIHTHFIYYVQNTICIHDEFSNSKFRFKITVCNITYAAVNRLNAANNNLTDNF